MPLKSIKKEEPKEIDDLVSNDDADDSSDTSVHRKSLGMQFKVRNEHTSFCTAYIQYKGHPLDKEMNPLFTSARFKAADSNFLQSQRLFLSKEVAQSEDRRMMPVIILNIDGVLGYWNTVGRFKYFVLRPGVVDSLITLSYDFRLVAVSSMS